MSFWVLLGYFCFDLVFGFFGFRFLLFGFLGGLGFFVF